MRNVLRTSGVLLFTSLPLFLASAQEPRQPRLRSVAAHHWPSDTARSPTPIAMAVSGGTSLGTYQAGVTWAVIEFYRATQDSQYRAATGLQRPLTLASIAGASAGNINAVIAAIEWCRPRTPRPPEASLFWRIWVPVGIAQLRSGSHKESNPADRGAFTRKFFRERLYHEIDEDMKVGTAPCNVPIGITLTKLLPEADSVLDVAVPIQRFAGVFRLTVASSPAAGSVGPMRFRQASARVRRAASLGLMMSPVSRDTSAIARDTIMAIVEASSAFPLAFAPRWLSYYRSAKLDSDGQCPRNEDGACTSADSAQFIDGGVFDNLPMSLAVGMYAAADSGPVVLLNYIDPGVRREKPRGTRIKPPPSRTMYGVEAVGQMIRAGVPAARKYELFTFGRALSGVPDPGDLLVHPQPTTRGHPIVGEHLNAFAGFLGRPFREFDFYAGVYDGMYFLATEYLCRHTTRSSSSLPDTACTRKKMQKLLKGKHLTLSDPARDVMAELFRAEFNVDPHVRAGSDSQQTASRRRVLRAIARANGLLQQPRARCRVDHPVEAYLCRTGFHEFLARLDDPEVRSILKRWAKECTAELSARGNCNADDDLVNLLETRDRYLDEQLDALLRRIWLLERAGREPLAPSAYARMVRGAHFLYRSSAEHYRRGLELDPSTIPDVENGKVLGALAFFPYYAAMAIRIRGIQFGWRPTYYLSRRFAIMAPLDVANIDAPNDEHTLLGSAGAGLYVMTHRLHLSAVHLSAFTTFPLEHRSTVPASVSRHTMGLEAAAYFGMGKFRLSARREPAYLDRVTQGKRLVITVGIADVNGLLYWWLGQ